MNQVNKDYQLLLPQEVCNWLRISKASFYKKVWEGQIPVIKIGKSIRVDKAKLIDYLDKNRR